MRKRMQRSGSERTNGRRWAVGLLATLLVVGAVAGVSGAAKKDPGGISAGGALDKGLMLSEMVRFDGLNGGGLSDWIEVDSWSWGETLPVDSSGGGGGAATGKVSMQDFHFTKHLDTNSPKIAKDCAVGRHIKSVTLLDVVTLRNGTEVKYLEVKFTDVLITSYQIGGHASGHELPMEEISLNYAKIDFKYIGQDPALSNEFSFDIKGNKEG